MLEVPGIRTQQGMCSEWSRGEASRRLLHPEPLPVSGFRVDAAKFIGQVTVFCFSFAVETRTCKGKIMALAREVNVRKVRFQVIAQKHYLKPNSEHLLLSRNPFLPWLCGCLIYLGRLSPQILSSRNGRGGDPLGRAVTPN